MFPNAINAAAFKDWSPKQRREEIAKLVAGYRNGLPVGILCQMSETIAGSRKKARTILHDLLTPEERQQAVDRENGGMKELLTAFFL